MAPTPGGLGGNVGNLGLFAIVDGSQQQSFRLSAGDVKKRVLPNVVYSHGGIGKHEATVLAARYSWSYELLA